MNENPLISVIIPVYKVEAFLDRCIKSIVEQTYENLEIILVDDGSPDRCPEMCEKWAKKDTRIKVVHKKNGGLSRARNVGLDICNGDYISFVDSDDWIESDMYSVLLNQLEKYGADLAVSGRYDVYENCSNKTIGKHFDENGVFDSDKILPKMIIGEISDFSVCDKLHKRNLWENVRFPEGEIYEDLAVMYKVLLATKKVVICNKPFYNYYHRSNSTVTAGFRYSLTDYPKQTKQLLNDIKDWHPEYTDYAIWSHIKAIQNVLIKLLSSNKKTYLEYCYLYKDYLKEIKKYNSVWKNSELFSIRDRLICEILLHKNIARLVLKLKNFLKSI